MLRLSTRLILGLFGVVLLQPVAADPDRNSLIEAWESRMLELADTVRFEATDEGVYALEDSALPYTGELRLIGALVRPADVVTPGSEFTHFGIVEFELTGLPPERTALQSYYYWLADRQTLHYSETEERWVDPATYTASLTGAYSRPSDGSFAAMSFMLNYGIWIVLLALIAFIVIAIQRQSRKARALMDESAAINNQARENLERAAGMQDEVLAVARESRDLQAETNRLLAALLEERKRS